MKKAAIGYIRVSTDEQAKEGISLAHQEAKIKAYVELHDFDLIEVVRDEGISAKSLDKRPGALRVIDVGGSGVVNAVIVYKLDRMFRNTRESLETMEFFKEREVAFHSVTEHIDTKSAMGKFFFTIMAACAEMERNQISERTTEALRHLKKNGLAYNHPPYGFDVEGPEGERKFVLNAKEQNVIAEMVELRRLRGANTHNFTAIANYLNAQGFPSKTGGKWYPQTVKNILEREAN